MHRTIVSVNHYSPRRQNQVNEPYSALGHTEITSSDMGLHVVIILSDEAKLKAYKAQSKQALIPSQ